jgi:hypothetical protein
MAKRGMQEYHIPFYQVDSHPEKKVLWGVTPEAIQAAHTKNRETVMEILRWTAALNPIDVSTAVIGEYEDQRRIREAQEMITRVQAEAEQARADGDVAKAKLLDEQTARHKAELEAEKARVKAAEAEARAAYASTRGGGGGGCYIL